MLAQMGRSMLNKQQAQARMFPKSCRPRRMGNYAKYLYTYTYWMQEKAKNVILPVTRIIRRNDEFSQLDRLVGSCS
jgi:hypothetical protein